MKFEKIRKECLKNWLQSTGRKRYINDVITDTYECKWQNDYVSLGMHNSFFCSLAEWNSHITDLLYDKNFDNYDYLKKSHRNSLFRHYTRILLITSEILTDFQDFIKYLTSKDQNHVRNTMTNNSLTFTCNELFSFINNICKHKIAGSTLNKYHKFNHHIDYFFNDSNFAIPNNIIPLKNLNVNISIDKKTKLEVPKLSSIIEQILFAYSVLDQILQSNTESYRNKLRSFEMNINV